jgi:hypothetical protein
MWDVVAGHLPDGHIGSDGRSARPRYALAPGEEGPATTDGDMLPRER